MTFEPTTQQTLDERRRDPEAIKTLVEALLPDKVTRDAVLSRLSDAVQIAHDTNPQSWEISLHFNSSIIYLNVGAIVAFGIGRHYQGSVSLLVDGDLLSPDVRERIMSKGGRVGRPGEFKTAPRLFWVGIPVTTLEMLYPDIIEAHQQAIQTAATKWKRCAYWQSYSTGIGEYLKVELGRKLPLPAYFTPTGIRYWKIAPGDNAKNWDTCRDGGYIAIGWAELGDLRTMNWTQYAQRADTLKQKYNDWTRKRLNQVWTLAKKIAQGDIIIANRGTKEIVGVGQVTGPYYFEADQTNPHRIPVDWYDTTPKSVNQGRWRNTLLEVASADAIKMIGTPYPDPIIMPQTLAEVAARTFISIEVLSRWLRAIERKKQAVLYGPPGTGKTYVASQLAEYLVGNGGGLNELVQFHPAYNYEDFMEGIRPKTENGKMTFDTVEGRFVDFCQRAKGKGTSVLIVDEINRANLARVFGELMYLLEYRDQTIKLAGGTPFSVPENVRILGTMNTADRSIALVDHALRRRFAFIALAPNYAALRTYHAQTGFPVDGLIAQLEAVNGAINDPNYSVGISFFLRPTLAEEIEDIWRMEIEPYLEEYFFDRRKIYENYAWKEVKEKVLGTHSTGA